MPSQPLCETAQFCRMGEFGEGAGFDLLDALLGEAGGAADLVHRVQIAVVKAETEGEHLALLFIERGEHFQRDAGAVAACGELVGGGGLLIGDELPSSSPSPSGERAP